ncbi:MAG: sugar kinase [Deltaproteobacteria bacterium]|nr:MAG: sugar kinase [Deltaproteobacteria bacterium]
MSDLLVVGSVAFDSLETPYGKREKILGGSGNYFSISASFFSKVRLVGVVGQDFPKDHVSLLESRGVDTEGLQWADGETFHWSGYYGEDLNQAHTIDTRLNVFETFSPDLPESYCDSEVIFLANIDPELQLRVLEQVKSPRLVACDTMNFWIHGKRQALIKLLRQVNMFVLNEQEIRDLSGEKNLLAAVEWVREHGPQTVVIKRGEYGAMLCTPKSVFWIPAFPLEHVRDPTGAGDTFAGGMMGYLSQVKELTDEHLRQSIAVGTVMASFNVERFSFDRLLQLDEAQIMERYSQLRNMVAFDERKLPFR